MATITLSHEALAAFRSSVDPITELMGGKQVEADSTDNGDGTVTLTVPDAELVRMYGAMGRIVSATCNAIKAELA